jgi:SAM-dependent methyltransferase
LTSISAPGTLVARALSRALAVLHPVLDIVDQPIDDGDSIEWCHRRGWEEFLLALSDADLRRAEETGLLGVLRARHDAPPSLLILAEEVDVATRLPRVLVDSMALPKASLRGVSSRKQEQLASLLAALSPLALHAERLVDVGAGSGHLSRLAAELFRRPTVGVDRDTQRSQAASAWAAQRARDVGGLELEFVVADACRDPWSFAPSDLLIGLHACGELGDRLVTAAAGARADLTLVSCCLQKIRAPERRGSSLAAASFALRRAALGLTNLSTGADGVETSLEESLRAREVRFALRRLLRARGVILAPGEEMRGINRRRARDGLAELAQRAFAARSLPAPTAAELSEHEREAARGYAIVRRLSLPRNLLARLVELCVVLDRAATLEERGYAVRVATFCERRVTPRNLALFASVDATRLPRVSEIEGEA